MRLHACEPVQTEARVVALRVLVEGLLADTSRSVGPLLLAVDGRSSNGKSTLAARIAAVTPGAEVVHTDDVAWAHSRFGWDDLLAAGIIEPLRRGEHVSYRPPAWDSRDRPGVIAVSAGAPLVIFEGAGAGRRSLAELVDAVIWVQSDLDVTEDRNSARIQTGELSRDGYNDWMAEEIPFQEVERTWEQADVVVSGTPLVKHDPETEIVLLE